MQVATGRHGDLSRLKREKLAPSDLDGIVVDCLAKNRARNCDFAGRQSPLPANRAGWRSGRLV